MCEKDVLENGWMLNSVPNGYKNQEVFNKEVDNYPRALEFVESKMLLDSKKCVIKLSVLIRQQ